MAPFWHIVPTFFSSRPPPRARRTVSRIPSSQDPATSIEESRDDQTVYPEDNDSHVFNSDQRHDLSIRADDAATTDHSDALVGHELTGDLQHNKGAATFPALYDIPEDLETPDWSPRFHPQQLHHDQDSLTQLPFRPPPRRSLATGMFGEQVDLDDSYPGPRPREELYDAILSDIRRDLDNVLRSPLPRPASLFSARQKILAAQRATSRSLGRSPRVGPLRYINRLDVPRRLQVTPTKAHRPPSPRRQSARGSRKCGECGRAFRIRKSGSKSQKQAKWGKGKKKRGVSDEDPVQKPRRSGRVRVTTKNSN